MFYNNPSSNAIENEKSLKFAENKKELRKNMAVLMPI